MKKMMAILLVLAMGTSLFTGCSFGSTKIDLSKYLTVTYSGPDGNGTASCEFDYGGFESALMAEWEEEDEDLFGIAELMTFESTMEITLDKETGLANGDKVKAQITFDEQQAKNLEVSFSNAEQTFEVSGLLDPVEIDAFDPEYFNTDDGVVISFSEISPVARLSIENTVDENEPISVVTYEADKTADIAKGDTITITASIPESYVTEEGYVLKEETITITADDIEEYVVELDSDTWEQMKSLTETASTEFGENLTVIHEDNSVGFLYGTVSGYEGVNLSDSAYFATKKKGGEDYSYLGYEYNALLIPFTATVNLTHLILELDNEPFDIQGYFIIKDIILDADGKIEMNKIQTGTTYGYTSEAELEEDVMSEIKANYNLSDVKLK